jgi:hypothetical protein
LARTSRAFAKQNIGCEGDNRQGAISIREVLFALPQRRDMPCGAAKMSASGPQAGMPTSSSLLEPHSARHGWSSLPSGAWQGPSKELPASLLQIGRQFYFLSQNEDFGIFLLDLWAGAKCFKLLGGQFQYRGNMRTLDVVHGNQIRCWKKTERHDTANCGAASLEINSQPYCRFFCSASLPSSGRGLPSAHNEFLDRMNRASKLSRPATTRRRD